MLSEDLKHAIQLDRNQIPRLCLGGLTFDGPFLTIMLNVLPDIKKRNGPETGKEFRNG